MQYDCRKTFNKYSCRLAQLCLNLRSYIDIYLDVLFSMAHTAKARVLLIR